MYRFLHMKKYNTYIFLILFDRPLATIVYTSIIKYNVSLVCIPILLYIFERKKDFPRYE